MRKFLFDVILGIFIGIGACIAGIIAIMDKIDELSRRSYGFSEVVNSLITDAKDLIHDLLYGYHHNRTYYKEWHSDINSRSCDTTKTYSSMHDWWNSTSKNGTDTKEDNEEEVSNGH